MKLLSDSSLCIEQNMLESKKQFVRYISHEIRTPLNTVFMGIQLARKQLEQNNVEDAGSILHDVEESCVTAVDILNDILLYDKIEDGRMELDKTDTSAHKLVKSVADLFMVQVCVCRCLFENARY
jgi:signal transduction histidine kinase